MPLNKVSQTQSAVGVDSCSWTWGRVWTKQVRKDAPGIVDVGLGEGKASHKPHDLNSNLTRWNKTLMEKTSTFKNIYIYLLI